MLTLLLAPQTTAYENFSTSDLWIWLHWPPRDQVSVLGRYVTSKPDAPHPQSSRLAAR
jgi:hypothetical protein